MIKFINRLVNTFLVIIGFAALIGLIYTIKPEIFQYIFQTLGLNETQVASATTILAGITVFGSLSKYLKGIVNTQEAFHKNETTRILRNQEERHRIEIDNIKESRVTELKLYSEIINEMIEALNETKETNKLILVNLAITAQRNLNSNIVGPEDKKAYKAFLDVYRSNKPSDRLKNLFTEVTIETNKEETETKPEENKDEIINAIEKKLRG